MVVYFDRLFRKSVPKEQKDNCAKKLRQLSVAIEEGKEKEFLNQNNAKRMAGATSIWKYRATEAYRILYVHTGDIPSLKELPDGIVLLRYSDHDKQGKTAANMDLKSIKAEGRLVYHSDFCFTENTTDTEANDYFKEMSLFRIVPSQIQDFLETTDSPFDVVLNSEQADVLSDYHLPLILYGCAGSGKTVLCAHLLYHYIQFSEDARGLYVTLSSALPENVKRLVKNISITENGSDTVTGRIDFSPISDFMISELGLTQNQYVDYDNFSDIFCKIPGKSEQIVRQLKQECDISIIDIWSEIRGIIKGHLDENWQWNVPISYDKLNDYGIDWLKKHDFIINFFDSDKLYVKTAKYANKEICKYVSKTLGENDKKQDCILKAAEILDKHFSEFDSCKKSISLQEYLSLEKQYTIYEKPVREKIYDIYKFYQAWMDKNGYYDDNDIARISVLQNKKTFDFIAVDEVQDLTEMQIYALTHCCKNPKSIVFAGDIHQVVNPTYYSEKRIKKLYYSCYELSDFSEKCLKKNYRSQDKIIKLANDLSNIRKTRIGSFSQSSELPEQSGMSGWNPMRLKASKENLINMVRKINELSYAVIIVPNDSTAKYISGLLDNESNGNIYTVSQIKGLEKRYVFCYNIASQYYDAWECIFSDYDIKKNSKYRYYFNALYVSVTRAQESLCFYEDSLPDKMEEWIQKFADTVNDFDPQRLFLMTDENAGEGWYNSARKCEENGDFSRAIVQYRKSQFKDYLQCIDRCEIRRMLKTNLASEALNYAFSRNNDNLFEIIKQDKHNPEISSIAGKILSFLRQDGKIKSTSQFFKDIIVYDSKGLILPELTEHLINVAFDKITDLMDYLVEEQKGKHSI